MVYIDGRPRLPSELMNFGSRKSRTFVNKTKMVAWFCSNKITHSKREDYVKELRKHVEIDVYGKCGDLTCEPPTSQQCDDVYIYFL